MNAKFHYHGWLIELMAEGTGYSFQCWRGDGITAIGDQLIYPTYEQALKVARQRADLESACLALLRFLNDIRGRSYYLTCADHQALTGSILEYARSGSFSS